MFLTFMPNLSLLKCASVLFWMLFGIRISKRNKHFDLLGHSPKLAVLMKCSKVSKHSRASIYHNLSYFFSFTAWTHKYFKTFIVLSIS